ncbi:hypothetical protein NM208_g13881 [Fusarium decemcellulare]|uniref:Uncharacterized protein n=1 Tax=Fusarium decemcellulare TaxID=57161 RepID=A0ACC1RKR4_9HYPO|nr:hypothetical protein NM208_g13881 [Fusarium decemcellulare]
MLPAILPGPQRTWQISHGIPSSDSPRNNTGASQRISLQIRHHHGPGGPLISPHIRHAIHLCFSFSPATCTSERYAAPSHPSLKHRIEVGFLITHQRMAPRGMAWLSSEGIASSDPSETRLQPSILPGCSSSHKSRNASKRTHIVTPSTAG